MADAAENLRTLLLETAAVTAIVNQRIFQDTIPQKAPRPFIWFQQRGSEDIYACLDDAQGSEPGLLLFDLECCADDISEAKRLAAGVRSLNKFRGDMGTQRVQGLFVEDHNDEYVAITNMSDNGIFLAALNVEIYLPG